MVVWIFPCPLKVWSLVGSIRPVFLGVGFCIRDRVRAVGANKKRSIVGEAQVCMFLVTQIHIIVPISLYTYSNRVVELHFVRLRQLNYRY